MVPLAYACKKVSPLIITTFERGRFSKLTAKETTKILHSLKSLFIKKR